jgi:hypothetical protein
MWEKLPINYARIILTGHGLLGHVLKFELIGCLGYNARPVDQAGFIW